MAFTIGQVFANTTYSVKAGYIKYACGPSGDTDATEVVSEGSFTTQ